MEVYTSTPQQSEKNNGNFEVPEWFELKIGIGFSVLGARSPMGLRNGLTVDMESVFNAVDV
jgi:hypothetical protein